MKTIPIPSIEYEPMNVSNIGPINKFIGVTTQDPYNAPVGAAASMKNLTAAGGAFPSLSTRPNFGAIGSFFGTANTGLGLRLNTELHAVNGGVWRRYSGSTWSTVASGLSSSAKWSFTNFKGNLSAINLIGVNGVDAARKYDGSSVSNLAGVPDGVTFKLIDQHDNRLYASDGKAVHFSALRKPEDWTTVDEAGSIQIETNTGEDVNAIRAGLKHLMVFKPNMFSELWGTGPHNYTLQPISETGALGLNAVTVHDEAAYWIHGSGIFRYTGGLPRKDFCQPVMGYIEKMNKTAASIACAGSSKDSVLFSIPTGGSTANETTLEYVPAFGIWTVWQDFMPTQWTVWEDKLAYGNSQGVSVNLGNSGGVSWEWISPPFGSGSFSTHNQWYKLMYVIDVPPGSTMTTYVSRKAEGNAAQDWIPVNTATAGALDDRRVILPIKDVANSNWLRVKFTGTGPVQFHELNIQQREMPLR